MEKYFLLSISILSIVLSDFCTAQYKLLNLSPEIRDTIDLVERDYYNLYPNIKDFHYAMIYFNNDSVTISKVTYSNKNGIFTDTVINHTENYEVNLIVSIRQINLSRIENFESDSKITVTKIDGKIFVGKLLSVEDSSFIICPDTISEVTALSLLKNYVKLNTNEVNTVFIENDFSNRVRTETTYGALLGVIPGVLISLNNSDTRAGFGFSKSTSEIMAGLAGGLVGALIGGALGVVVGLITSPADETIKINSTSDIEHLKDYINNNY